MAKRNYTPKDSYSKKAEAKTDKKESYFSKFEKKKPSRQSDDEPRYSKDTYKSVQEKSKPNYRSNQSDARTEAKGTRRDNNGTSSYRKDSVGGRKEGASSYRKSDSGYSKEGEGYRKKDTGYRSKPDGDYKPAKPSYKKRKEDEEETVVEQMPLNKYIAHCGICSRREAVELIKKGKIKVNALVETEPSYKVQDSDYILYDGKRIQVQNNKVYILLNKPKGYITTLNDPNGRRTVIDLVKTATEERVYPVGRLDRNTTGLIVLTNDGDFAQKLAHPKYNIKKVYQVKLNKGLDQKDYDKIKAGVVLDDGKADVDDLAYVDPLDASILGIQIHIGKNRIVRRIFEHLGYTVEALDRVLYATLTKKNLPRGKWRMLTEKEVRFLKHYNS